MNNDPLPSAAPSRNPLSRRAMLARTAATAAGLAVAGAPRTLPAADPGAPLQLGFFTKALQWMDWEKMADLLAELGYRGIECPIRKKGQIVPERVDEDLPRLVEVLAKRGLKILQATTDAIDARDPDAVKVLRALSKNGVRLYRLGTRKYVDKEPIAPQLERIRPELRELASLNAELGIVGAIQNHSGAGYVGAPIWDIWELVHDLQPATLGISYDIGHSVLEGGYTWPINFRLMQPHLKAVYVKEFRWEKDERGDWKAKWGPLGEGMMPRKFLPMLRQTGYSGFLCHHLEYMTASPDDRASQDLLLAEIRKDHATIKGWLQEAGFTL